MDTSPKAPTIGGLSPRKIEQAAHDVVEVGLLLPANRIVALLNLAKLRDETVGQMVRRLIDRELAAQAG